MLTKHLCLVQIWGNRKVSGLNAYAKAKRVLHKNHVKDTCLLNVLYIVSILKHIEKEPQGLNFTQMLRKSLSRLFLLKLKTDFFEFFFG